MAYSNIALHSVIVGAARFSSFVKNPGVAAEERVSHLTAVYRIYYKNKQVHLATARLGSAAWVTI